MKAGKNTLLGTLKGARAKPRKNSTSTAKKVMSMKDKGSSLLNLFLLCSQSQRPVKFARELNLCPVLPGFRFFAVYFPWRPT